MDTLRQIGDIGQRLGLQWRSRKTPGLAKGRPFWVSYAMPILRSCDEAIARAAEAICGGALAAFPTETVYGLGGDAFSPDALAKIFEAKGRPRLDPLIVHIAEPDALEKVADLSALEPASRRRLALLAEKFWPGPLTLILPKRKAVPDIATSGLPTVAVRIPAHETARRLIALSTGAVAAPSANPFGRLSPTRAEHVEEALGEKVDIILDGGPARIGLESTVLDLAGMRILRPGGAAREEIEALIGPVAGAGGDLPECALPSPGLLKSHYAPRSPLSAHTAESIRALPASEEDGAAFLFFGGASRCAWLAANPQRESGRAIALSEAGDAREAAAHLFQALRELDRLRPKQIHAQLAPEEGLGAAINDRLLRASRHSPQ